MWLSRNKSILKNTFPPVGRTTFLALSLSMKLHRLKSDSSLDAIESSWMVPWVGTLSSQDFSKGNPSSAQWILQLSFEGLVKWIRSSNQWTLQLDGASKVNLGVARGGGILINPEGIIEDKYSWGLGRKKRNQAEAYGFLFSLTLAQKKDIRMIEVLVDSMLIIKHMNHSSSVKNMNLNQIIKRFQGMIPLIEFVSFFIS